MREPIQKARDRGEPQLDVLGAKREQRIEQVGENRHVNPIRRFEPFALSAMVPNWRSIRRRALDPRVNRADPIRRPTALPSAPLRAARAPDARLRRQSTLALPTHS